MKYIEKYKYLEKKKIGKEHQHGLLTEPRKKGVRFQYLTLTHVLKNVAYVNKSLRITLWLGPFNNHNGT